VDGVRNAAFIQVYRHGFWIGTRHATCPYQVAERRDLRPVGNDKEERSMPLILWLLGVPLGLIVILWLIGIV